MADLVATQTYGETIKVASATYTMPAGQWIQMRHGTPQAPADDLLSQVPAGKAWTVRVFVQVNETDA